MSMPKAVPAGFHTVTPYLRVRHIPETIAFLKETFGATDVEIHVMPEGRVLNAQARIGDSIIMFGETPQDQTSWPAMLYVYIADVDAVFARAVKAGGKIIMQPADQFYGDRTGAVEDLSGNQWWIATRKETVPGNELVQRALAQKGR